MKEKDLKKEGVFRRFDDPKIQELYQKSAILIERYNTTKADEYDTRIQILHELLGKMGDNVYIKPPFYCDCGELINIGEGTFMNFDCIILDSCEVNIGHHVLIGPRTCIFSASHPIDVTIREEGYTFSKPVTIGNHVWIGGNVTINPGVTIGDNTIIGSGSVVTKDIPANVIAAGNPCHVIRPITQQDHIIWKAKRDDFLQQQ